MLNIKAQENAVIKVVKGSFPLGQRNTIKIDIEDNAIRQYIEPLKTGNPKDSKLNLFPYGTFDEPDDINNLHIDLTPDSICDIESDGVNYSNCLHFKTENKDGLGTCQLIPSGNLEPNTEYVLTFDAKTAKGEIFYLNLQSEQIVLVSGNGRWSPVRFQFTTPEDIIEDFKIDIIMSKPGEGWIDNLQMFKASDEYITNKYNNIYVEVKVLNPTQYYTDCEPISKIVRLQVNENDISVILYMPPITVVDYRDNLLCQVRITVCSPYRVQILGDSTYHDITTVVYESQPFVLSGFVLSGGYNQGDDTDPDNPDNPGGGCDCDYEIAVDEI